MSQGLRPNPKLFSPTDPQVQGRILGEMPVNPQLVAALDDASRQAAASDLAKAAAKASAAPAGRPDLPERPLMAGEFVIPPRVTSSPEFSAALDRAWQAQFQNIVKAMVENPKVLACLAHGGMVCRYQIMSIPVPTASSAPAPAPHPDANPAPDPTKPLPL